VVGGLVDLSGSVVLVTGASGGIGAATCTLLAKRGARVIASGRDAVALEKVAADCGGTALAADLRAPDECTQLVDRAIAVHGRVDGLVANAGVGLAGKFEASSPASLIDLVQVNLTAPMLLARALLPGLLERGQGHLAFVGSIAGLTGVPGEAAYSATKAGISGLVEALAQECHSRGVTVSSVVPGVVDTGFFERRGVPYGRRFPRLMPPEKVAQAIVTSMEQGRTETIVPRWLGLAPRVRALSPGGYRFLARRFGKS
jgi:short-subunit dehydrogenase